jgi:hypothetical protein
MTFRSLILLVLALCAIVGVYFLPPISQDAAYHNFADRRTFFSIPNFWNVVSNVPFIVLGLAGLYIFFSNHRLSRRSIAFCTLFIGIAGIGLGSAYYHWNPNNTTLVWDRIPMTVTFMSFFAIIVSNHISERWGFIMLLPLLLIGVLSVIMWYYGEADGNGDLRLYALVQFLPMLYIPLIVFIYPTPSITRIEIVLIILLYAVAKFFENRDVMVFNSGEIISGHTVKHLFAAAAVYYMLKMIKRSSLQVKEK